MQNALKPFGAKATDLFNQQFNRSRLTLTALYVIILAVILFVSGNATHFLFSQRLDDRFFQVEILVDTQPGRRQPPPDVATVNADLMEVTLTVNGVLLLIAGVLSYWLAGLTLRPIQTAYNKQRQFLSDVSHELRTPLAILQTNVENEQEAAKTQEAKLITESYLEEIKRMSRLVNDLLTLSRLGDQKTIVENEIIDVTSLLKESVMRLKPLAEKQGVTLLSSLEETQEVLVAVPNKDLLMQAITNVILNAILYNKEQGQVEIKTTREDLVWNICVQDTGVGIAQEHLSKVFDRFYRADKSRSRRTGGSGLGLSITQSILHACGGFITLASELGKGTTVVMTLPIHKAS